LALFRTKILDVKKIGEKNGLERIDVGKDNGVGNQNLYLIYKTAAEAKIAFHKLNNFKFDKNHTLLCYTIKEIQEVLHFNQEYHTP
jgi:hypothetical protein